MTARVVPSECPRCKRGSETWSFDRKADAREGTAGCPCGEVIPVAFEGGPAPPPLSTTPRTPRGWKEERSPDAWHATLRPSSARIWAMGLVMLLSFLRTALVARSLTSFVITMVLLGAFATYLGVLRRRRWSFAFENGRFRVDAMGEHHDVALEEILTFEAGRRKPSTERARDPTAFSLSLVRTGAAPVTVPLYVDTAEEAQWVADRANAVLASGGRIVDAGYRGERLRVATDEPEPAEEESERDEPSERRARRS